MLQGDAQLHIAALALGDWETAARLVRDSKHDSDAIGWAEFFRRSDIVQILEAHAENT